MHNSSDTAEDHPTRSTHTLLQQSELISLHDITREWIADHEGLMCNE